MFIGLKNNQFYVNKFVFSSFKKASKDAIVAAVKTYLMSVKGIKQVWTYDELKNKVFEPNSLGIFYKNQLYLGRSGEFIIALDPYCQISKYTTGTSHCTPYQYDTHVPLIFYQNGVFEEKEVKERVSMLRVANTVAEILKVPKPPASMGDVLPALYV